MSTLSNVSVLVTGGAGFIGSHFVDRLLLEEPRRITVVDNFFLGRMSNLTQALSARPDIEVVHMDASDQSAMQDIAAKVSPDVIFDFAVIPLPTSLEYPAWCMQQNVGIATALCEVLRRGLAGRLFHLSSSEALGSARYVPMDEEHPHDSITPYAASKSAGDRLINSYVQTFGINATVARPFNNVGPRQNLANYAGIIPIVVRRVLAGQPIAIHGDGEQTRDIIFAPETVDVLVALHATELAPGEEVNVASGVEVSVNDLVRRILMLMDRPQHPVVHTDRRPGDVRRHCADVSKLKRLTGREIPSITDAQLLSTIEHYRQELG